MNRRGFFKAACGVALGLLGVKAAKAKPTVVGVDIGSGVPVYWPHYTFTYPNEEVLVSRRWLSHL